LLNEEKVLANDSLKQESEVTDSEVAEEGGELFAKSSYYIFTRAACENALEVL